MRESGVNGVVFSCKRKQLLLFFGNWFRMPLALVACKNLEGVNAQPLRLHKAFCKPPATEQ
jgi:hypothetical protein